MSVNVSLPEISALKMKVRKTAGFPIETHNDFLCLVDAIECALSEHMSESTLERLWGYSTRTRQSVSLRTLNVLSRFVGAESWVDFVILHKANSARESEEFHGEFIDVANLEKGSKVRLSWLPDRQVEIVYLGDFRFEVVESINSSMNPGDSFSCIAFRKGQELYLDKYSRKNSGESSCYVIGQHNGITAVELI